MKKLFLDVAGIISIESRRLILIAITVGAALLHGNSASASPSLAPKTSINMMSKGNQIFKAFLTELKLHRASISSATERTRLAKRAISSVDDTTLLTDLALSASYKTDLYRPRSAYNQWTVFFKHMLRKLQGRTL